MKTYKLNKNNVDNLNSDVAFLNSANDYELSYIPDCLKQVIIFVPYSEHSNVFKARAKALAQFFQNQNIIIVDTKYTHKTAHNCNLTYKEVNSTALLAIDYVLNNGYDKAEVEPLPCLEKEQSYYSSLVLQEKVSNATDTN